MLIAVRVANSQGRLTFRETCSPENKVLAPRKTTPNRLRRNKTCNTATSAVSHLIPASWMAKHRPPMTVMEMPRLARLALIDLVVNSVNHSTIYFRGCAPAYAGISKEGSLPDYTRKPLKLWVYKTTAIWPLIVEPDRELNRRKKINVIHP